MKKLADLNRSTTQRVLLFGGPKTGKTELAGRLSEHFKIIWVDLENGHETLFKLPKEWQERITLISLPDTRSYPIAIETCLKLVKGAVSICDEHGKVACMVCKQKGAEFTDINITTLPNDTVVVFDSLTQLSNSAIANITKGQPDDYKLDYDDWGNLGKLLDIFLSHIQQGKYNSVVISHEIEAETEAGKKYLVPVGGTRNFSRNVAKYFDTVVYCERKNKKHTFGSSTSYASNILTGSRSDVALENEEAPSLLRIFKPELYPAAPAPDTSKTITKTNQPVGGNAAAQSVLDKLRSKK